MIKRGVCLSRSGESVSQTLDLNLARNPCLRCMDVIQADYAKVVGL